MILTFIFLLLSNIWALLFQALPTVPLPAGIQSAIDTVVSWMYLINVAVDVNTLMYMVGFILALEATILGVEFLFWAYSKLPIIGKK